MSLALAHANARFMSPYIGRAWGGPYSLACSALYAQVRSLFTGNLRSKFRLRLRNNNTQVNPDQQQPLQQKQQQQGNRRVSPPQTAEQQQRSGQRPFPFTSVKTARRIPDSFAPTKQILAPQLVSIHKSTFNFDCEYCE